MDDRQKIDNRVAELKAELAELETAARVLERLNSSQNGAGSQDRQRLVKLNSNDALKTITDYAKAILAGAKADGMHFNEVAEAAMSRGYRGRKGSDDKAIRQAFWVTMRRHEDSFEMLGEGRFKLK